MKLIKEKRAILFIYIAVSIAVSGYLYINPSSSNERNGTRRVRGHRIVQYITTYSYKPFQSSLIIEGVGLFLLLGVFAHKANKEGR